MIAIEEAFEIIDREAVTLATENVRLDEAGGRVLHADVFADSDMPPFDRSQMDGYAVRAEDVTRVPVELEIVGEAAAGKLWHGHLQTNQAVRIMTGAPVPAGANSVQQREVTRENATHTTVTIEKSCAINQNIVRRGSEIEKGACVIKHGTPVTPSVIASLAAFGIGTPPVSQRPRVAILATGAELVAVDATPRFGQIRNSNSVMLAAYARQAGATIAQTSTVDDSLAATIERLETVCASSEVIIISGGASVGDYDFVKPALTKLTAEIYFDKVRLRPGKPTIFARLGEALVFGLPGNPVSAAVTFNLFVRRLLRRMQAATDVAPPVMSAILQSSVKSAAGRDSYLPATFETSTDGKLSVRPLRWGGSSDFVAFTHAQGLIIIPADTGTIDSGSVVQTIRLP